MRGGRVSKFPAIESRGKYYTSKKAVEKQLADLEAECARLRYECLQEPNVTVQDSTEPKAVEARVNDDEHIRIYIVWAVGMYPNGVRLLDIRAVTTSLGKAKLYSKMLRANKTLERDRFERVIIEPRIANHLYGESLREMDLNTGRI